MPFYSALTTLPSREAAEALAESLEGFDPEPTGVGCFEIEDGSGRYEVGAYFEEEPDDIVLALMAAIYGAAPFAVSEVPQTDWVAHVKRELQPVEAGRFFVYGSHDADKVPEGAVALLIEAAMAFGTGHHGTTKGCLLALDRIDRAGFRAGNVADIGCGTAVLAMAAEAIWHCATIASDIDPVAVDVARSNVAANGQAARVQVVEAAGFDQSDLRARAPYDLIFANILKGPLLALAPDLVANLAPGGRAILSGILTSQADELVQKYMSFGLALTHREDIGEWVTLELVKS
ncbi:50S ribosomal protein L11 methyltransferase [Frigidibacter sp. RF13]|uniref:50S ribosomal protein L11 methyltransferase n=1 Tax=Frigidibacter sp. RF13 TaxID=2997340 RepID=UPI00226E9EB7|nr:50S ribosomal protein L11 methyltransferase [Frigidibacter sp. RF13]MCY1126973.1 50S ribosomal protein L11 methyltransferase [Frigidibacter sp. RF13]